MNAATAIAERAASEVRRLQLKVETATRLRITIAVELLAGTGASLTPNPAYDQNFRTAAATALRYADILLEESQKLSGSTTWPYVLAFAKRMEAKLDLNRNKGDRAGWIKDTPGALLNRLRQETDELSGAIVDDAESHAPDIHKSRAEERADEAADVANFAMMIADVCGGVKP